MIDSVTQTRPDPGPTSPASRAAALTPDEVRAKTFRTAAAGGFVEAEVRAFLGRVADALAEAGPGAGDGAAVQVLVAARHTADETVAQARADAERLLADARRTAAAVETEAQERADAVTGGLTARRAALQAEVDGLRAFEREYRVRLRAYLVQQLQELEAEETFQADSDS